jgi:hypothetical protein
MLKVKSSSGYKGVYLNKKNKTWISRITKNRELIYLGSFKDKLEAVRTYNEKAKELFGKFAYLNDL